MHRLKRRNSFFLWTEMHPNPKIPISFPTLDAVSAPVTMTTLDFISGSFENDV